VYIIICQIDSSCFFVCRLVPLVRNGEIDNEPAKYLNRLKFVNSLLTIDTKG